MIAVNKFVRTIVKTHRLHKVQHLQYELCKAASKFSGLNITSITGYGTLGKKDDKDAE
jgi:hypothetical protein